MMAKRELLFSVTKADFDIDTFRAGGKGGQHQNKTDSAVRLVHRDSGAIGESRSDRSQHRNRKIALQRLMATPEWRIWHARKVRELMSGDTAESRVEKAMAPENLKVEVFKGGEWVEI